MPLSLWRIILKKSLLAGLGKAGLGNPLIKLITQQSKLTTRNDELMSSLLTCLMEMAPHDTKVMVGLRLGGGSLLCFVASMLQLKPVSSSNKLLVLTLKTLMVLCKSPPNALQLFTKGYLAAVVGMLGVDVRNYEIISMSTTIVRFVLGSAHKASTGLFQKGFLKTAFELLVEWTKLDAKFVPGSVDRLLPRVSIP